jgi:hypothetical protein
MKQTYSQLNQDINVINFYNGKKNGFFIDIGAHDGISLSNTYLLEQEYVLNQIQVYLKNCVKIEKIL